jgi:hypothetical protein
LHKVFVSVEQQSKACVQRWNFIAASQRKRQIQGTNHRTCHPLESSGDGRDSDKTEFPEQIIVERIIVMTTRDPSHLA